MQHRHKLGRGCPCPGFRSNKNTQNQFYDGLCFVVILLYGSWPCLPHTSCTDDANATKVEDKSLKEIESIEIPPVVLEERNDPWP